MTDHEHEWRMNRDWTGGIVARCDVQDCRESMGIMEVNRVLNEHVALKRVQGVQERLYAWSQATFGYGQRANGVYAHLLKEIKELGDDLNDGDELADCALLLFDLASHAGVDLLDAIEKKFKINKARKWGPIQPDGSIEHIKEE